MIFYYIENFKKKLKQLIKKDKGHSHSCPFDISNNLKDLSLQQIKGSSIIIYTNPPIILAKRRIGNSGRNLSKQDGFRLYLIIDSEKQSITLCDIFSKKGAFSHNNLNINEEIILLKEYFDEIQSGSLSQLDINDVGAIIQN
jgi:hypothetical protein